MGTLVGMLECMQVVQMQQPILRQSSPVRASPHVQPHAAAHRCRAVPRASQHRLPARPQRVRAGRAHLALPVPHGRAAAQSQAPPGRTIWYCLFNDLELQTLYPKP